MIGRVCICGAAALPGSSRCARHQFVEAPVDERARRERQPYRRHYASSAYRANRLRRFSLAQGRCESCGTPLRSKREPQGALWECDHVVEVRRSEDDSLENLRVLCTACHKAKTAASRRAR